MFKVKKAAFVHCCIGNLSFGRSEAGCRTVRALLVLCPEPSTFPVLKVAYMVKKDRSELEQWAQA